MRNLEASRWFVRITAWSGLASEVISFLREPLRLPEASETYLHQIGIVLFLIALISWLEASNKGLEKLDQMGIELKEMREEHHRLDLIARYGSGAVWLARLLHLEEQEKDRFPHCLAGGIALSELLLDTYTKKAEDFTRVLNGKNREVTLAEASIINTFISKLVCNLPEGSVWMGTSRLQDAVAWANDYAEPSFTEFKRRAQERAKAGSLTWLRVLCCENEERYEKLLPVAKGQMESGLDIRILVRAELPDDISLIWIPKVRASKAKLDLNEPINSMVKQDSKFEPLCAIKFEIRGNREVFKMNLVTAGQEFDEMCGRFARIWREATKIADQPAVA